MEFFGKNIIYLLLIKLLKVVGSSVLTGFLFRSDFQAKSLYAFLISLVRSICPTHLILLDLITLVILCRVHEIFRTRLPFTNAAYWTCASSLSLTPTPFLPLSLPWVALLNSTPLPCRTSSGKFSLEIRFGFLF
jgi:hypothetical protein